MANCLLSQLSVPASRLDPSWRRKSVLHVRVTGLPILLWSRSSKHFLPHSCSSLKLPLFDASVPSLDACSQRGLWRYHTRFCSVQCFAAAALASCSLAHPACFQKVLRTLFVHTEHTVVFPFRTSNVIRSVRSCVRLFLVGYQRLALWLTSLFLLVPPIS